MLDDIAVTDGGPIEGTFKIDLSPGPGAYEFRGARGTGKTTLISSIDWLTGHKVDVTLHDGAVSGSVTGFGVVAPIGGRKRRKGDFELDTIDAEKFSLTDLIDPPGRTPEVRDAHAIKALAVLSEAKADQKLYHQLAGGQKAFDALGVQKTTDPVLLATRVKTAYDKQAKEKENTATAEADHAAPLEVVPDGLDLTGEADGSKLQAALEAALERSGALQQQRTVVAADEKATREAQKRLEAATVSYDGPTLADARQHELALAEARDNAQDEVIRLREQLEVAEAVAEKAEAAHAGADNVANAAAWHEQAIAGWQATIDSDHPEPVSDEEMNTAIQAVTQAREAIEQGARIRDVKQNKEKAAAHREAAREAEKAADEARNKAQEVFDLLAQSLHTSHLQIKTVDGNPRLFVDHPKRGTTAFDRVNGLSDGERVDFTLRELLPHLQSPGLLPIPQQVWQDLQPIDRQNLHDLAVEKGLFLFGAQVDDGELRVVFLGNGEGE
jgi:hypothetical protein